MGDFACPGSMGSTTLLGGFDMTTCFDNIIPKIEQGITTIAGVNMPAVLLFMPFIEYSS